MSQTSALVRLPVPVSINQAYRNVPGRGRVKTRKLTAWLKQADMAYLMQKRGIPQMRGLLILDIRVPEKTRGDITNRIKTLEDWLVSRNITGDDKHNWRVSIERDPNLTTECEILVRSKADA